MKILIINSNRDRFPWPTLPLGACYVATSLKEAGFEVRFLDLLFSKEISSDITRELHRFAPDLIGVSIRNIDNVDQQDSVFYLDDIKRDVTGLIRRETLSPIIIGGSAVNIMPEKIMDFLGVDYAAYGDGEGVFLSLAKALAAKSDISHIGGLFYRKEGRIAGSSPSRIKDLDSIPFPKIYQWIDCKKYKKNLASYPVQTKRGCAQKCSYCVYNKIEGMHYRLRDPRKVVDEIEDIVANCRPHMIEFTDSTFNIPLDYALAICRGIIKRRLKVALNTMGINPGGVTEELVSLMKEANFKEISCTPESGSQKVLEGLCKNFTIDDVRHAAYLLRKAKIPVVWYFLFGGPGEDRDTIAETFRFIEENIRKQDLVFITSGIRILPGSPIQTLAEEKGQIGKGADLLYPVWFQPRAIDRDRMLYLINREVITHSNYINLQDNTEDSIIARSLKSLYAAFGIKSPIWANIIRRNLVYRILGYQKYRLWKLEKWYKNLSHTKQAKSI